MTQLKELKPTVDVRFSFWRDRLADKTDLLALGVKQKNCLSGRQCVNGMLHMNVWTSIVGWYYSGWKPLVMLTAVCFRLLLKKRLIRGCWTCQKLTFDILRRVQGKLGRVRATYWENLPYFVRLFFSVLKFLQEMLFSCAITLCKSISNVGHLLILMMGTPTKKSFNNNIKKL